METQVHELPESQLDAIAKKVVAGLVEATKDRRKELRSNAYHNTRTLLRNYYRLKTHCKIVEEQVEEDFSSMWNDWRFDVDSLLEHKAKTAKLMKHVDKALIELKAEDERAYDILNMKYLLPKCFADEYIAAKYSVDRRTIGKWIKKAVDQLSVFIFGIDVVIDWL